MNVKKMVFGLIKKFQKVMNKAEIRIHSGPSYRYETPRRSKTYDAINLILEVSGKPYPPFESNN